MQLIDDGPDARPQQSEQQALEAKALLAMALRLGRLGAWVVNLPQRTVEFSPEARLIHELAGDFQLTVEGIAALMDPQSQPRVAAAIQACIDDGRGFDLEAQAHTTRGKPICVRMIGEAVRDAQGRIVRIQGAVQDITETREAAQRAHDLGERLAATLESVSDAFFTIDRSWRFTYVNGEAERLLQRQRGDLLGKVVWDEFPEAAGTIFHREYERALAEVVTVDFETFYPPLGVWLTVTAHPSAEGLAVYFRDVTDARRARAALADSEEQYRMLFESSMDGILQTRPDGSILRANAAACAMFGMTQDQICEAGRGKLVAPEDRRADALVLERAQTGSAHGEVTMARGDGSRFEAELASAQYQASDGQLRTYVVLRDITERLKARHEILSLNAELADRVRRRTAQLEEANTELKAFAHSLAHDLRSPICAIHGFGEVLHRSLTGPNQEKNLHYLDRIRAAARQMDDFTDALLSLARLSQAELHIEDVNLSDMVRDVLADLQDQERGRTLLAHIQPGVVVRGDRRLLEMALQNLLGNAWKFTSRRAVAEIAFTAAAGADGQTVYCIADNGAGFDMAYAGKLFGHFQRLHTQSEFPGTGIGLANAHRIIRRHGGSIWPEAKEGEGAKFYFTLGADPGPAP
jgi:PAS domain S-box-containing protein